MSINIDSTSVVMGSKNIIMGIGSGINLTWGSRNIIIGTNSGRSLTTGNDCLIIGHDIDVPDPTICGYVNILGKVYETMPDDISTFIREHVAEIFKQ
jgi:hypothetical protein